LVDGVGDDVNGLRCGLGHGEQRLRLPAGDVALLVARGLQ
jgi:hypothetical protein